MAALQNQFLDWAAPRAFRLLKLDRPLESWPTADLDECCAIIARLAYDKQVDIDPVALQAELKLWFKIAKQFGSWSSTFKHIGDSRALLRKQTPCK